MRTPPGAHRAVECADLAYSRHICVQSQVTARQGSEAVSVRLGALTRSSQAQLDGFKSRVLRAEAGTQRHFYVTDWRVLDAPRQSAAAVFVTGDAEALTDGKSVASVAAGVGSVEWDNGGTGGRWGSAWVEFPRSAHLE